MVELFMPSSSHCSLASCKLKFEVYFDGSRTASISFLSNISAAIAKVKAESIPPDSPSKTPLRLLFLI